MQVALISTYELGHQPFGLASPAAWLADAGGMVRCYDLAVEQLPMEALEGVGFVAFYVPMHTATRMAGRYMPIVLTLFPALHICCYGLYAPVNELYLRGLGADTILGGEFEEGLVALYRRLEGVQTLPVAGFPALPSISLARQKFHVPDRRGLPALTRYAHVQFADDTVRTAGYTEASR